MRRALDRSELLDKRKKWMKLLRRKRKLDAAAAGVEAKKVTAEMSKEEKYKVVLEFEEMIKGIHHTSCARCKSVSMSLQYHKDSGGKVLCSLCRGKSSLPCSLPTWVDEMGDERFDLPEELQDLREGEKLLIQRLSPYVPLQHLSKGSYGSKGHVCCFPQDVQEVCNELPRLPSNVNVVRVVKRYKDDMGEIEEIAFTVRKDKVMKALVWLRRYNTQYKDIKIVEGNFDWMKGKPEEQLPNAIITEVVDEMQEDDKAEKDIAEEGELSFGVNEHTRNDMPTSKDNTTTEAILDAMKKTSKGRTMKFPFVSVDPVSEYDETEVLFCKAFPWLFPGGVGDYNDYREEKLRLDQWMKRLIYYGDGRFARDKMWGFFAMNYVARHQNQTSGQYFVDGFYKDCPSTLEGLQSEISKGNTTWIDQMSYYTYRVRGSAGYWRYHRNEIHSWITHHIEEGHGAPTFFITLSCAEFYWPDVLRLIRDRYECAGLPCPDLSDHKKVAMINDFALIVQEYFQLRVQHWLETVGKKVFGIKYHWLRYEFAPGRGQIHAHMLAITEENDIQQKYFEAKGDDEKQTAIIEEWLTQSFDVTATVSPEGQEYTREMKDHPSQFYCGDCNDMKWDDMLLQKHCQNHGCTGNCMRKRKYCKSDESPESKKRRVCRAGAGVEQDAGKGNTPGFALRSTAAIVEDLRGFKRIDMKRNDRRTMQSSLWLCKGWRANCDLQAFLYESNPKDLDASDVARVTDYIVSYIGKGVESLGQEKSQMTSMLLGAEEKTGNQADVKRIARKILNRCVGEKMYSKQEAMVQLAGLDLFYCSEQFENVSITGRKALKETTTTFMSKYSKRPQIYDGMSMHQYFKVCNKKKVPHYTGGSCTPVFPVTEGYARAMLMIHKPWKNEFNEKDEDFVARFEAFLASEGCPSVMKIPYERMKLRYEKRTEHVEPISKCEGVCYETFTRDVDPDLQDIVNLAGTLAFHGAGEDNGICYDFGVDFDWSRRIVQNDLSVETSATWLDEEIRKFRDCTSDEKQKGKKSRTKKGKTVSKEKQSTVYDISKCHQDQQEIIAYVLQRVQEWVSSASDETKFIPLRMTVTGEAGSGKSVMIHTLVKLLRELLGRKDTVAVCGPTGSSAFGAGGETIHRLFGIPISAKTPVLGPTGRQRLLKSLSNTVALVVDERSMVCSEDLALMELYSRETMHGGRNNDKDWGGCPIIIFVGDDYQLPPIMAGAFDALHQLGAKKDLIKRGHDLFLNAGLDVMDLTSPKRVLTEQQELQRILKGVRGSSEEFLSEADIEKLTSFHWMNKRFTDDDRRAMKQGCLHLFANKEPRDRLNEAKLFETHSEMNPVAKIKAQTSSHYGDTKGKKSHFKEERAPSSTLLCVNAQVEIGGKNLCPEWGLYNGSLGIVRDIVFREGEDPNSGNLPAYVVVEFNNYVGPEWDKDHPTYVPIPVATALCDRGRCCTRTFIPLKVAFGKTIHTFQGASVGPVRNGQRPNCILRILCDPESRDFEGINIGLFYTLLSRITTLGTDDDELSSAIYFTGQNMNAERIRNITKNVKNHDYKKVEKRREWTNYLESNSHRFSERNQMDLIFEWAKRTKLREGQLQAIISYHVKTNARDIYD